MVSLPVLQFYKFGTEYNLSRQVSKILRYLRKKKIDIDIIHAHFTHKAGVLAYRLSRALKCPYVITERSSPFPLAHPLLINEKGLTSYMSTPLHKASKVIGVSQYQKHRLESFGIKRVEYIPNFISEHGFKISERKVAGFQFITVGSLIHQKGMDDALKAFARCCQRAPLRNFSLKIVGEGAQRKELEALSKNLHIDDKVTFCGALNREGLSKVLQESHCFLLASRHESFGIVAIEAMASGLPIVGTKCGGLESIVVDGSLGHLVPIGNVEALASAMIKIAQEYDSFSPHKAREYFLEHFSSRVGDRIINLYKESIASFDASDL